jgi:hypothetical protein
MRSQRNTTSIVVLVALAFMALTSASAFANPLLSGYGGPGQGDQAILGAALLNGPSEGGGSGGGGQSDDSTSIEAPVEARTAPAQSGTTQTHASGHAVRHHARQTPAPKPAKPAAPKPVPIRPLASSASAGGTLGLSGTDLAYILLALAALAVTAVATSQLAGASHQRGGQLKG